MANQEQLAILKQGVEVWNKWREENPNVKIDLSPEGFEGTNLFGINLSRANLYNCSFNWADLREADLTEADLGSAFFIGANLIRANFIAANLNRTNLSQADLSEAKFSGAVLYKANFEEANLKRADLSSANLFRANFYQANLEEANLKGVNLTEATLINAKIDKAKISGSSVYGVNIWDLIGEFEEQRDLIITNEGDSIITVDNIKVAQFIYLILNNEEIRDVINTLTSKSVLILGRFSLPERKTILDTLRNKLREYDLLPIVFDFDRPTDKDFTETINTLVGLCYFVIADVTNPKSSPLELQATVPDYQIPFVPIIQEGESPFAMMVDLQKKYNWVLNTVTYDSMETLIKVLKPLIIDPAMKKRQELRIIKAQEPEVISGKDYLEKGKE